MPGGPATITVHRRLAIGDGHELGELAAATVQVLGTAARRVVLDRANGDEGVGVSRRSTTQEPSTAAAVAGPSRTSPELATARN